MLKSNATVGLDLPDPTIDSWENEGGLTVCANSTEKQHTGGTAQKRKLFSG